MKATLFDAVMAQTRRQMPTLFFLSFLANLLLLASAVYMLQVYGRVLSSGSIDTLLWLTAMTVGAIIAYGALEQARRCLLGRIGGWLDTQLAAPVIERSIHQRLHGDAVVESPLTDVQELRGFLGSESVIAFLDAPWTPVFVALIWIIHPVLGGIAAVGAIALFICAVVNDRLTRPRQQLVGRRLQSALAAGRRYVDSAETVAALGMTRPLTERWSHSHRLMHAESLALTDTTAALFNISRAVRLALQVLILGAGAFYVLAGDLTPGAMIATSIILSRALSPVERSISAWRSYVSFRAACRALKALFDAAEGRPQGVKLPRPLGRLTVEGLRYTPPSGGPPIIKKVDFSLQPGETCGMIGPSGSGKSSLCRLIVGVWKPSDGHVRLDGADVAAWDRDDLGRYVGYLPQQVELFPGTIAENIARMQAAADDDIIQAARLADVHEMILQLPQGYATDVGVHGSRLSGGQRQRIGLARALFGNPPLVVLDEPSANLDAEGDRALITALAALKAQGRTIVVVAHHPAMLRTADKILLLRDGMVARFGPRDHVLKVTSARRLPNVQAAAVNGDPTEPRSNAVE